MMETRVAVVPVAEAGYDLELAEQVRRSFRTQLIYSGLRVVGGKELAVGTSGVQAVIEELASADFDLLVIFQATFTDSSSVTMLAEAIDRPLFLWAIPEAPAGDGLRLNALSGLQVSAHALTMRRIPYQYAYAAPGDRPALNRVTVAARAAAVARRLSSARLGLVTEYPLGSDSDQLDDAELATRLGVEVIAISLPALYDKVLAVGSEETDRVQARLGQRVTGLLELDQDRLTTSLGVYTVLKRVAAEQRLDGLALSGRPEFVTDLDCSACGALSMLGDEQIPCSGQADMAGTLTQLILHWLSGGATFGGDIVAIEEEEDALILWHPGQAPLSLADPTVQPRATVDANHHLPLLLTFALKPGRVTLARLSRASGQLRLMLGHGEIVATNSSLSGTGGAVRLGRPAREVLEGMIGQGLEHHICLTYGDHLPALETLAGMLSLPVIHL